MYLGHKKNGFTSCIITYTEGNWPHRQVYLHFLNSVHHTLRTRQVPAYGIVVLVCLTLALWKDNGLGNRKIRIQLLTGTVILSSLPFYFFFNIKTRNYTMRKVRASNLIFKKFTLYIY
jgi:hypothetical protein